MKVTWDLGAVLICSLLFLTFNSFISASVTYPVIFTHRHMCTQPIPLSPPSPCSLHQADLLLSITVHTLYPLFLISLGSSFWKNNRKALKLIYLFNILFVESQLCSFWGHRIKTWYLSVSASMVGKMNIYITTAQYDKNSIGKYELEVKR